MRIQKVGTSAYEAQQVLNDTAIEFLNGTKIPVIIRVVSYISPTDAMKRCLEKIINHYMTNYGNKKDLGRCL